VARGIVIALAILGLAYMLGPVFIYLLAGGAGYIAFKWDGK